MEFRKDSAPYIRRKDTSDKMMLDVIIALSPVLLFSYIVYGLAAFRNIFLSIATMLLCELVFVLIMTKPKEKLPFKDNLKYRFKGFKLMNLFTPIISGAMLGMLLPAAYEKAFYAYPTIIVSAIFGIVIGKLVFGGTGQNIFNPALTGMIFAKICFGAHYRVANYQSAFWPGLEGAGATFLRMDIATSSFVGIDGNVISPYKDWSYFLNLLIGRTPGLMGEVCKVAILLGLIYLLIRRTIDWRITTCYLGSFFVLSIFVGLIAQFHLHNGVNFFQFALYQLFSGGLLFGAVYMATDPVTSPINRPSRVMYGLLLGVLTILIRLFARQEYVHEGVAFSILICNMLAPALDYYKWSGNKYTKKKLFWIFGIGLVGIVLVVILSFAHSKNPETIEIGPTIVEKTTFSLGGKL